jgi:hypothetical protein
VFQCRKRKKKANKQASDTDCALQTIYLSEASAKEQHVMHDPDLRQRCELLCMVPAKRPFVIGMWQLSYFGGDYALR